MAKRRALNLAERIEIQAGLRAGESQAEMARRLGRSAGAISGELKRNGGGDGYQAEVADRQARARRSAARHGRCHIEEHPPLRAEVHARLRRGWSPEEVAGSLCRDNPDLPAMHTSHESIYRYAVGVLRQSPTYDQGKEMAEHPILAANLQLKVFFCHAHSPWERATCESQNDRIRHYLPKGTDLSLVSYQQLRAYQDMLNERPRKILNWKPPAQCFHQLLVSNQRSN